MTANRGDRPPEPLSTETVGVAMAETAHTVHLVRESEWHKWPGPARALCGVVVARPSPSWFELAGCKRCCKKGLAGGLAEIIDTGGRRVALADVEAGFVRD